MRRLITRLPPESRMVITMFQLFFFASASAPAMTFLACSRVIGGPYIGGAWAAAEPAVKSTTMTKTAHSSLWVLMGLLLLEERVNGYRYGGRQPRFGRITRYLARRLPRLSPRFRRPRYSLAPSTSSSPRPRAARRT